MFSPATDVAGPALPPEGTAGFAAIAAPTRQPDRLQFTVRIVKDDGQEHTVTCDEEAASEPFLELVRAVQKATRK